MDAITIVKQSYQAYVDKDRAALEAVITDDFHFTSPLDNRIDRRTYLERCWPNSKTISGFRIRKPCSRREPRLRHLCRHAGLWSALQEHRDFYRA